MLNSTTTMRVNVIIPLLFIFFLLSVVPGGLLAEESSKPAAKIAKADKKKVKNDPVKTTSDQGNTSGQNASQRLSEAEIVVKDAKAGSEGNMDEKTDLLKPLSREMQRRKSSLVRYTETETKGFRKITKRLSSGLPKLLNRDICLLKPNSGSCIKMVKEFRKTMSLPMPG